MTPVSQNFKKATSKQRPQQTNKQKLNKTEQNKETDNNNNNNNFDENRTKSYVMGCKVLFYILTYFLTQLVVSRVHLSEEKYGLYR